VGMKHINTKKHHNRDNASQLSIFNPPQPSFFKGESISKFNMVLNSKVLPSFSKRG